MYSPSLEELTLDAVFLLFLILRRLNNDLLVSGTGKSSVTAESGLEFIAELKYCAKNEINHGDESRTCANRFF